MNKFKLSSFGVKATRKAKILAVKKDQLEVIDEKNEKHILSIDNQENYKVDQAVEIQYVKHPKGAWWFIKK
jgi:desulfoferrodoxin (superoxide reductase-like protein)